MTDKIINLENTNHEERQVWVVFSNHAELPWSRALKKGFRHCFILINDGEHWISVDPMANFMEVVVHHVSSDFDLPYWLYARGHNVISAQLNVDFNKSAPWMLFLCVGACKRILGVRKLLILTPWQLYCHLAQKRDCIDIGSPTLTKIWTELKGPLRKGVFLREK